LLGLGLPQILFIDGLTSNLGHEGEDLERVNAVYDYLIELSEELGDQLQLVVADNDVPLRAHRHIRLRLEENDRLIRAER
jgi:predicted ABC-type transport system involved in lysophospholipase L1 biosynthesis ATPase subunit